jgi:trk system potassium uptake protein TrkH
VPIGGLTPAGILILYLLMFVGASPAGTGGGLKSTTAVTLLATALSSLRGAEAVSWRRYRLPVRRVQQAAGTLVTGLGVIFTALVLLDVTGRYPFDQALFEVISALSTVGLSMGLTGSLNDAGKLVITAVMFIGRVGMFAFFAAFAASGEVDERPMPVRDVIL